MTEKKKKRNDEVSASVASAIGKVVDYAFNPSRAKLPEMTVVSRPQALYFSLIKMFNVGRNYALDIARYRMNSKDNPMPQVPDLPDQWLYFIEQYQKSIAGKNLEKATDLALAEIEAQMGEEGWKEDEGTWRD